MNKRNWPYLWGAGTVEEVVLEKDCLYIFPECMAPFPAVEDVSIYSTNPDDLGAEDVVLTGEEFIDELEVRGIVNELGAWSS